MTPEQIFGIVFAVIFVCILIREVTCYYFKINARLDISKQILVELKKINEDKDQL